MFDQQGESDAEVVSEGPKAPPPPPRQAELKPAAAGESFGVFDGPVDDAPNARKKPSEGAQQARQAAKQKATGRKAPSEHKKPAPPPLDPEEQLRRARAQALQLLELFEQFQLSQVRSRYSEHLVPSNLDSLCEALKYKPIEKQQICEPLAEGMIDTGVQLPWWARFGIAMAVTTAARVALLQDLELKVQKHREREAEAEKNKPANVE